MTGADLLRRPPDAFRRVIAASYKSIWRSLVVSDAQSGNAERKNAPHVLGESSPPIGRVANRQAHATMDPLKGKLESEDVDDDRFSSLRATFPNDHPGQRRAANVDRPRFDALTVEGVAARAGIGKATSRWPSVWAIVMDGFMAEVTRLAPIQTSRAGHGQLRNCK